MCQKRFITAARSIDVIFESVAEVFGMSAIGVLLSGANADGAEGLSRIKQADGFTIVQDPASAEVGYMPQQALERMKPDEILKGDDIGDFIKNCCNNTSCLCKNKIFGFFHVF
jgi:two-component system chemotaxis response regulator CheB